MCQQIGIAKDSFYSSMREGHKYDASNFERLDELFQSSLVTDNGGVCSLDSRTDADVDPDAPICIGMDYNANINWTVEAVYIGNPMRHDEKYLLINQGFRR